MYNWAFQILVNSNAFASSAWTHFCTNQGILLTLALHGIKPVLHLQRFILITASWAGDTSVKMGIKTSPNFSNCGYIAVLGKLQMGVLPYHTYEEALENLYIIRLPSLMVNCYNPAVLCTYSILHLLGYSCCQIYRTSAPYISLSMSPWGQLARPWPLNLQRRVTHLHLQKKKKHEIPQVCCFFQVPKLHILHQYCSSDYQIHPKPNPLTEGSSALTKYRCLEIWCERDRKNFSGQHRLGSISSRCQLLVQQVLT